MAQNEPETKPTKGERLKKYGLTGDFNKDAEALYLASRRGFPAFKSALEVFRGMVRFYG